MAQKVNPNIFRLGKTKNFKNQYFEKKNNEASIYALKSLEIQKFIYKFFKNNGLEIQNCELQYINENCLNINIVYYLSLKTLLHIAKPKTQNNKFKSKKNYSKNYSNYKSFNYNLFINEISIKKKFKTIKKIIKIKKTNKLKYISQNTKIQNNNKLFKLNFLEKFFKSLKLFVNNNINIFLTLKQLNKNIKKRINLKQAKSIKKKLVNIKKYEKNDFFKEGINILYYCAKKSNSANLLAKFISTQLQKLKKHNFFLKFIKSTLTLLKSQNIKIKIKGRFNGAPRAKHRIINIGNGVPVLTLNSNIDYAEKTSYTLNGTFGVKVWIYEQKINLYVKINQKKQNLKKQKR